MPEDGEAWRRSLRALDEDAQQACGKSFAACSWEEQAELIQAVQDRGSQDWHGMRAHHVWSLWTRYACAAFYSHPWAWNEIGFGGPAYPRGYKHIGFDAREPWEVPDQVDRDPVSWGARVAGPRRRRAVKPRQETEGGDSAHGSGGAVSATPGES
jgi:hypothetical protein